MVFFIVRMSGKLNYFYRGVHFEVWILNELGFTGFVISFGGDLLENCISDLSHMKFGIGFVGSSVTKLEMLSDMV